MIEKFSLTITNSKYSKVIYMLMFTAVAVPTIFAGAAASAVMLYM